MYFIDPTSLVQATLVSQPRAPKNKRHHLFARAGAQTPSAATTKAGAPKRRWTVVSLRHAYS